MCGDTLDSSKKSAHIHSRSHSSSYNKNSPHLGTSLDTRRTKACFIRESATPWHFTRHLSYNSRVEQAVSTREVKLRREIEKQRYENALLDEKHEFERLEKLRAEKELRLKLSLIKTEAVSEKNHGEGREEILELRTQNEELERRISRLEKGGKTLRKRGLSNSIQRRRSFVSISAESLCYCSAESRSSNDTAESTRPTKIPSTAKQRISFSPRPQHNKGRKVNKEQQHNNKRRKQKQKMKVQGKRERQKQKEKYSRKEKREKKKKDKIIKFLLLRFFFSTGEEPECATMESRKQNKSTAEQFTQKPF
nr:glutamic acid-rich protein-like [Malus domestica]